jgi:hypothetical protein
MVIPRSFSSGALSICDRRRQRRLAMIDVAYRAYVYMRLGSLKLLLRHLLILPWFLN